MSFWFNYYEQIYITNKLFLLLLIGPVRTFDLLKRCLLCFRFQKYGKIDIVVCNAAANPSTDPILSSKEAVLDKLWEINVKSSILLLQVKLSFY